MKVIPLLDLDTTGNVDFAKFINGGGVELYHNNIKRLDTTSGGINVGNVKADGIRLDDNDEIRVGTGDDLKFITMDLIHT